MRIAISNNIQPGEAAKAAGAALSEMEALSIAPTPVNYAVWFQYKLGEPAALVQDMIALVNSARSRRKTTWPCMSVISIASRSATPSSMRPIGWTIRLLTSWSFCAVLPAMRDPSARR